MKTIFIFLSILLMLASCTDVNKSKRLATLDNIKVSTDSLENIISKNRADSRYRMSENVKSTELKFKQFYYADSVDREFANDVNDLKQARKILGHLNNDCLNILKGCTELKESVRLLRYDIDNADGDRKKYNEYVAHENSKFKMLNQMGDDYIQEREKAYNTYDRLFTKLDDLSTKIMEESRRKKKAGK